jgi:hypothetical protein
MKRVAVQTLNQGVIAVGSPPFNINSRFWKKG